MKILGITGGVGAGKSTILAYLSDRYQAECILCDRVAEQLQKPGAACFEEMRELLEKAGVREVLLSDGSLNRRAVAAAVFANGELLQKINAIVHPAVKAEVKKRLAEYEASGCQLAVIEAALLLEDHYDAICDEVWYIHVDTETRIRRLALSRGYSREKSEGIIAAQSSEAFFRSRCALVIDNSSEDVQNTYRQIDEGLITHEFM